MTVWLQRRLVDALFWGCERVDSLPNWTYPAVGRWLGCPNGMAMWAFELAEMWGIEFPERVLDPELVDELVKEIGVVGAQIVERVLHDWGGAGDLWTEKK